MNIFLLMAALVSCQFQVLKTALDVNDFANQLWTRLDKPHLLLRLRQNQRTVRHKLLKWDLKTIDQIFSPYAYVASFAEKLIGANKLSECTMQYYENSETAIIIEDDYDIFNVLEAGPDIPGNKRLIDVICPPNDDISEEEKEKCLSHPADAMNAYKYVTLQNHLNQESSDVQNKIDAIGAFDLEAEGLSIFDVNETVFSDRLGDIADEWEFDDKTRVILHTIPSSCKTFESHSSNKFDPADWKIKGSFVRLAAWRNSLEMENISMHLAMARFEILIPRQERDGTVADKYLGASNGTISQKFMDDVQEFMQNRAAEMWTRDISKPMECSENGICHA